MSGHGAHQPEVPMERMGSYDDQPLDLVEDIDYNVVVGETSSSSKSKRHEKVGMSTRNLKSADAKLMDPKLEPSYHDDENEGQSL